MRISNRLKCISEFVEDNDKIIDIGCDHALLDIYLMNNKNNINLIASDIHEGAIKNAKKNISKHALLDKIDLRLGDGLNVINENEVDTIIIAGMGYYSIEKKMNKIKKIIVQSNTDVVKLRKFVIKLGYKIEDELLVKDKDIIYTIIKFTLGKEKYSYEEIYFGPKILSKKDDLFLEYYNKKLLKYENLLLQLPKYEIKNILHHKHLIRIIKKELSK